MNIDTTDPTYTYFTQRSKLSKIRHVAPPAGSVATGPKLAKPIRGNKFAHTKTGYRPDLACVTRSSWESNVMRVFQAFEISYEYEPLVFYFPIRRGVKGYCPDLYLPSTDEYVEVKGYFDSASRIKIKRFKIHYPKEFSRMTLIIGRSQASIDICKKLSVPRVLLYPDLERLFRAQIPTWE